jgi:hypothetical protein
MDLSIKTLRYNALLGRVQVGIAGELDNLMVQIGIQFPFQAGGSPKVSMREVALLEAQQILRAVATASVASLLEDEAPQVTSTRGLSEPLVGKFIWRRSEWNTSLSLHFWPLHFPASCGC